MNASNSIRTKRSSSSAERAYERRLIAAGKLACQEGDEETIGAVVYALNELAWHQKNG